MYYLYMDNVMTIAEQIYQAIRDTDHRHYGLRACSRLTDAYKPEWLIAHNLPVEHTDLAIGDVAPCSWRWDDGDITDDQLEGTSAMYVDSRATAEKIARLLSKMQMYWGKQLVLLAADHADGGEDNGEIVMYDATVIWETHTWRIE